MRGKAETYMPADNESCELLRAIARLPSDAEEIRRCALKVRDWDLLLETAQEHRVLPMLFLRLADMGPAVPTAVQERLRAEYDRNVFHNLANAAELIAVLKAFEEKAIPVMPFKGVVLGAALYRDPAMRAAGDLDLLIHYQHLSQATAIMLERGYELITEMRDDGTPAVEDYYEYHFERLTDGRVLELRWRFELTYSRFKRELGMDWVWPHRRTVLLAGAVVPNMSPEITLLVLCMHGSKHIWSRLNWICDVTQLLASTPDLNWKEVIREAKKAGLWRALALGVLLANRVAGVFVPEDILRRFESDTTALHLAQHIQENLFVALGSTPAGRVPYHFQLLSFRDRVGLILLSSFLRPNERDRAFLPLPKPLHALYYLIRPFRMLWDRSAR